MKKLPVLISFFLLAALVTLYFVIPSFQIYINGAFDVLTSDDGELIRKRVAQFKLAGPVVLILLMIVQMFLFVVPSVFVMMVAIASYGPFWGGSDLIPGSFCIIINGIYHR